VECAHSDEFKRGYLKKVFKQLQGFSILELMIAGSLLAGLSMAGLKLFENQSKAQKTIEANHEITSALYEIRTILGKQVNCTLSLFGLDVDSGVPTGLKKETSPGNVMDIFIQNSPLPNNIMVKEYRLHRNLPELAPDEGLMAITFSRGKGAIKETTQKTLKYIFSKNSNNKITSCTLVGEVQTDLWKKSPGNNLDIYYQLGSAAIGAQAPDASAAFEIKSTQKGFLPPRLTQAEREAIPNPAKGLLVFDSDENTYYFFDGSSWSRFGGGDSVVFW
jgi:hypothetical protein